LRRDKVTSPLKKPTHTAAQHTVIDTGHLGGTVRLSGKMVFLILGLLIPTMDARTKTARYAALNGLKSEMVIATISLLILMSLHYLAVIILEILS
jgi:hypothetical protein